MSSGSVSTISGTLFGHNFYGLMEEFILYDKAYYIVDGNEFIMNTGDISDFHATYDKNISQNARVFTFDYHNIRGKARNEVATSPQVSWRTTTI